MSEPNFVDDPYFQERSSGNIASAHAIDPFLLHPEFAPNQPTSEVAVKFRSLKHIERDPKFKGSPHDACGAKDTLNNLELELLKESEKRTLSRHGHVLNDNPDLLINVLKHHQSNIQGKRNALRNWFHCWSKGDLQILQIVVSSPPDVSSDAIIEEVKQLRSQNQPLSLRKEFDDVSKHPFILNSVRWTAIARSHGKTFLELLNEVLHEDLPDFDRDAAWALLVNEMEKDGNYPNGAAPHVADP